ncbi:MAG: M1 family metallopeptidase [Thermoanaerobaculia bacterium]
MLLAASATFAVEVPEYAQMRAARPDGRTVQVQDLTLARDEYRFTFNSGTFHFLEAAGPRTWGAVFIGDGKWELRPAIENERRHLALVANRDDLEVMHGSFDAMVVLFTDRTAQQIFAAGTSATGAPDRRAVQLYEEHLDLQKRRYQINLHLRILQEILNESSARGDVFIASIDKGEFAPWLLIVDRHGIGALAAAFADLSGESTALISFDDQNGGFWYLHGPNKAPRRAVDAIHYAIDTAIEGNLEMAGVTTIRLQALKPGVRVVPIHILPKIRLRRISYNDGGETVDAAFVQEEVDLGRLARLFRDEVADADAAVVLPSALPVGKPVELRVEYDGREILRSAGADSYSVRARESWYPNLGTFADTATYELTYRYPRRNDLVSTGVLVSEKEEGGKNIAVWKSDVPMRIAGFNYGKFEKKSRADEQSEVEVSVFTSRDRRKFADNAMADALNAARVGKVYFGKAPYSPFSVTQQVEWNFGQSWPSLIYLPTLALTSSTERVFGFEEAGPEALFNINEFANMVGWHEVAHQWWGHAVGWQSYRDAWISEGFAEFTAALVLNLIDGRKKYDDYWERRRRDILEKPRGASVTSNDAGPISQGFRLNTRHSPGASQTIIYSKGAYVIHMLRAMMRDSRNQNPDERFIVMMKDFLAQYSWKSASTDDFRKVVDRHMTPQMNAGDTGTMEWFFNQWVHGTEVPKFRSTLTLQPVSPGVWKLSGEVSQEGVSADFRSVVPLYVDFGGDAVVSIGSIRLVGSKAQKVDAEMPLPRAPKRVLVNALHDILARE